MKKLLSLLPWALLGLFVIEIVMVLLPKPDGEFHTREFGRLPVLVGGRVQPLDSVARNALLQIRGTGDLPLAIVPSWQFWRHPPKLRSTEWLLEVLFRPAEADQRPIFLIHHPDLLEELRLTGQGIEKSGLRYFTFAQLEPVLPEIDSQARLASQVEEARRNAYQKQVLKLANAVWLYQRLKNSIQPERVEDFAGWLAAYLDVLPAARGLLEAERSGGGTNDPRLARLASMVREINTVAQNAYPLVVPPAAADDNEHWRNLGTVLIRALRDGEVHPLANYWAKLATGYRQRDARTFNEARYNIAAWFKYNGRTAELQKGRSEYYFNQIKLFLHATIINIIAFVLAAGALLTYGVGGILSESLRRAAHYLIGLAFVLHTAGLVYRMILEGRPPVTNLYSSAIFIGWGTCILGLVLERIYRVGLGSAVAGLAGFTTLLIAHNLALGGDTMEMLRAVLDTNFWLATHVVVITLGYSSVFVAGGLGVAYVVLGVFTPLLALPVGEGDRTTLGTALEKMVYGITCFAMFFSFLGTVLGGLWADQSWGRFWGWDPKENGALLIVIWLGIMLHARWGGMVRGRGLMQLAIFGNIVTAFSWFGTNMLGIGLHSYGFMEAGFQWLLLFYASQLVVIKLGLLPLRYWRSFRYAIK